MSSYLNAAALETWAEVGRRYDEPLTHAMGRDQLDLWVNQMLSNARELATGEDAHGAQQVRRIGALAG